jgi:radical SAM protein with 4Fe4S-binding SPASM domain
MAARDLLLGIRKGYVLAQLLVSYAFSSLVKRPFTPHYPFSVSIEPINHCNLHCPECPTGNGSLKRTNALIKWGLYKKIIDELAPGLSNLILYFQGEPLLHPQFPDMVRYAHQKRIHIMTSTNGQLITDGMAHDLVSSGLDHIIVSMDGITQEVYEQYRRGGSLQKVMKSITALATAKKELKSNTPHIEAQFIVMQHNEDQIAAFLKMAKEVGADSAHLKTAQIDWPNIDKLVPRQSKFSRYHKTKQGTWEMKRRLKNRCWRQWSSAVITSNGDVLPCCFDKNGEHSFGNLKQASFHEIWHGEKATAFRYSILRDRKQFEMCHNCTS